MLFGSKTKDISYGRFLGPMHPDERKLEARPDIVTVRRRVFVDGSGRTTGRGQDVRLEEDDLKETRNYLFYKSWSQTAPEGSSAPRPGDGKDVLFVHGLYDAGGRWAPHIYKLLESGFRVIALDLPTHGRSSGIHCFIKDENALPLAVDAALRDAAAEDLAAGRPKHKAALVGHSLGGWTVLSYGILSPFESPAPPETDPEIFAIYCMAPYLGGAKEAIPHPIVQAVGRGLNMLAPALQMVQIVTGLVSDHPDVDAEFYADPQTYSSKIRVATGISLLGMTRLINDPAQARKIAPPVRIVHGLQDRVCDPELSKAFVERMKSGEHAPGWSEDKEIDLWDGYEHVMHAYAWGGLGDAYEEKRDRVLKDMHDWLVKKAAEPAPSS